MNYTGLWVADPVKIIIDNGRDKSGHNLWITELERWTEKVNEEYRNVTSALQSRY